MEKNQIHPSKILDGYMTSSGAQHHLYMIDELIICERKKKTKMIRTNIVIIYMSHRMRSHANTLTRHSDVYYRFILAKSHAFESNSFR